MTNGPRVQIVDYRLGNLFSIQQACDRVGLDAFVSDCPQSLEDVDGIILPGVGAFGNAMDNLRELRLLEPLRERVASDCPLFGVCLGMQLLFEESEEFGRHAGLGILSGCVKRLPQQMHRDRQLRIPNVGWHRTFLADPISVRPVCEGIRDGQYMYYVHSYHADPEDSSDVLTFTHFGDIRYCSAVQRGNIVGVQFHPERSAEAGLQFYRNWAKMVRQRYLKLQQGEVEPCHEPLTATDDQHSLFVSSRRTGTEQLL